MVVSARRTMLGVCLAIGCGAPGPADEADTDEVPSDTDDTDRLDETDDTDDTDDGAADLPPGATPWGDASEPPPPGAVDLDAAEIWDLHEQGDLVPLDPDAWQAARDEQGDRYVADVALVGTFLANHPEHARRLVGANVGPGVTLLADGNRQIDVGGATVVVQGAALAIREFAATLRAAADRSNTEAIYAALHARLPPHARDGLTDPAATGALDLAALDDALQALTDRLDDAVPSGLPTEPYEAWAQALGDPQPTTGCTTEGLDRLEAWPFTLRPYLPPVRDQARRGSCVAFGTSAALEVATAVKHSLFLDLSEQELYAQIKGSWFPSDGDFADGAPTAAVAEKLVSSGFRVHGEGLWPYNPSPQRKELGATYRDSCLDYEGPACSNTNHQLEAVCTFVAAERFCWWWSPRADLTGLNTSTRATQTVSLFRPINPELSLSTMRAFVDAGVPIVAAIDVDGQFKDGVREIGSFDEPLIDMDEEDGKEGTIGGHAIAIVGFVTNAAIETTPFYGPEHESETGGYFVVRNSWGCGWGHQGYVYLGASWLADRLVSATAVVGVDAVLPTVSLSVDRTSVTEAGDVVFTADTNSLVTQVRLYRGEVEEDVDDTAPFSFTVPVDEDANGVSWWHAVAEDAQGNEVISLPVPLTVWVPDGGPTLELIAPEWVVGPTEFLVRVTASDDDGLDLVQLRHGFEVLWEGTEPPGAIRVAVGRRDFGPYALHVFARDLDGHVSRSDNVVVEVLTGPPPEIDALQVTPAVLPPEGGTVTAVWSVAGADTLVLDPGGLDVTGLGTADLSLPPNPSGPAVFTTITLTAQNAHATRTATRTVQVGGEPLDGLYVDPARGDDATADGSLAQPYATIAAAAAGLASDGALVLADGDHVLSDLVSLPTGTSLRAEHPGLARLRSSSSSAPYDGGLVFEGSGGVEGVVIGDLYPAVTASTGSLALTDVRLDGLSTCRQGGSAPVLLTGDVAATWTPGSAPDAFVSNTETDCVAIVRDAASLHVDGGRFATRSNGQSSDGVFTVEGAASLHVEGATFDDLDLWGIWQRGGDVVVEGTDFLDVGDFSRSAVIQVDDGSSLIVEDTQILGSLQVGLLVRPDLLFELVLRDVLIEGRSEGVSLILPAGTATFERVTVTGAQDEALDLAGSAIIVKDCTLDGGRVGLALSDNRVHDLTVRGTTFRNFAQGAVRLGGSAGSSFDLGTDLEPGGNDLAGNHGTSTSYSNLRLYLGDPDGRVDAVGNTWDPLVQGADADGRYTAGPVEVTGEVAPGGNHQKTANGTLWLLGPPSP